MVKDERDKLKTILPYWIEHSKEHSRELRAWVDKTTEAGKPDAAEELATASLKMDEAARHLEQALNRLP